MICLALTCSYPLLAPAGCCVLPLLPYYTAPLLTSCRAAACCIASVVLLSCNPLLFPLVPCFSSTDATSYCAVLLSSPCIGWLSHLALPLLPYHVAPPLILLLCWLIVALLSSCCSGWLLHVPLPQLLMVDGGKW